MGWTTPKNYPSPLGDLHPHGSFRPLDPAPKWNLDQFSRFSKAQERDQQADKPTDHATCVAIGRYR